MAKKAAKRARTRSKKSRKKAAKKSSKKAVKVVRRKVAKTRRKAAKKAARKAAKKAIGRRKSARKKAARRPKAAKKVVRKIAKKAAKAKRPIKAAPKAAKPVAPRAAPMAPAPSAPPPAPRPAQPPAPAMAPKPAVPSAQPRPEPKPQPAPAPSPAPQPEQAFLVAGKFDPGIDRYYSMLAQNTPESHRLGTLQVDRILAGNPKDIIALAEKAHDIVNNWRNDVLSPETIKECQIEFATGDPFACANKWAQRSIDAARERGIANPYGHWAKAYIYKYQKQPNQSAAEYKIALALSERAFIGHTGRRRKDLVAEWLEGLVYWARRDQLQKILDKLKSDAPSDPGKSWINWVKCFAHHLLGQFAESNALFPDYLPDDRDVNLIIAANYARLGREDLRQLHRKLFLEKEGNANWSAAKEIERSPFADTAMRDFWYESVEKALRAPAAAPPSAAPTQSI